MNNFLYRVKIYEKYSGRYSCLIVMADTKPKVKNIITKAYEGKKVIFKYIRKINLKKHKIIEDRESGKYEDR
jgi:hypothetical protein